MIHAIGDSFTYGEELPSQDLAWPALLSNKLNVPVINKGRKATGNTRITKRTIDAVIAKASGIVIGWSDCCRREFADEFGIFDLWAGRNTSLFQDNIAYRKDIVKYMTVYDTPEYYYTDWLRKIILVQSFVKSHKIPCSMFIAVGSHFLHKQYKNKHSDLINMIDQSMFIDNMYTSVAEWTWGTPNGPNGHPLEQGHEIIANKIYEHIRNQCWFP
jgi:hypothetical protein